MTIATCQSAMQEEKLRRGPWVEEEDERLATSVKLLGERKWDSIARESGLKRSGKSCRMRWLNYLRPNVKRGHISAEEGQIIIQLQKQWGNKWSKIARKLPGRTDNEIKNYWRTYLRKKVQAQEGEYHCKLKNAKQDCIYRSCDISVQECDTGDHKPVRGNKGGSDPSPELCDLSSLVYPSSPYEIRLFDWMSELSDDHTELRIHCNCSNRSSCFCYLTCNYEDSGSGIFDCLGSLWDVN